MMRKQTMQGSALEISIYPSDNRSISPEALRSLREFRKQRIANRQMPCQPKAA